MSETKEKPPAIRAAGRPQVPGRVVFDPLRPVDKPQEYYDEIKQKFAEARDLRLSYRPEGRSQYNFELTRRGNRAGQGHRRGAEALVHAPVQTPLL
jgi:hypothetical protein